MGGFQCKPVPGRAETADDTHGLVRQIGMLTERFAGMHIRQMNFDKGYADTQQGIAQGNAGMSEGGRVDDDERGALSGSLMDPLDQFKLGVALEAFG